MEEPRPSLPLPTRSEASLNSSHQVRAESATHKNSKTYKKDEGKKETKENIHTIPYRNIYPSLLPPKSYFQYQAKARFQSEKEKKIGSNSNPGIPKFADR
ncbi:hypothetical protein ONS95_010502 [Cadophora gregata]|uniref:uncharacterized protein n=1 Tax=Cadophora gregata TaxID=51156 RepID=UPI0026DBA6A2|nr:uncharacterized protein ONS95_010502 [Cadophora gregata]KAK0122252.1 hypothetical protein ONS95_010502 [Cadophora gregata]